jgi:ribosomal protein S18 acetylase RimI-like enzyme
MITYRDTHGIDLAAISRLFAEAGWRPRSHASLQQQMDGTRWVVSAWDGERLVGLVRAISDGWSLAYVSWMMVDSAYRRQGIGRELMRRLVVDRSTVRFVLHASDSATSFYRAIGFSERTQMMTLDRLRDE